MLSGLLIAICTASASDYRALALECIWSEVRSGSIKSLKTYSSVEGDRRVVRFELPYLAFSACPTVSENKRRIAFLFDPAKPSQYGGGIRPLSYRFLVLYDPVSGERKAVDAQTKRWRWCRLSPDGSRVIAIREREGQTIDHMAEIDLLVINATTGKVERVLETPNFGADWLNSRSLLMYRKEQGRIRFFSKDSKAFPARKVPLSELYALTFSEQTSWCAGIGTTNGAIPKAIFLNLKTSKVFQPNVAVSLTAQSFLPCAVGEGGVLLACGEGRSGRGIYSWANGGAKREAFVALLEGSYAITDSNASGLVALIRKAGDGRISRLIFNWKTAVMGKPFQYGKSAVDVTYSF